MVREFPRPPGRARQIAQQVVITLFRRMDLRCPTSERVGGGRDGGNAELFRDPGNGRAQKNQVFARFLDVGANMGAAFDLAQ